MPVCGVVCLATGKYESFETCLHRHENYTCSCHALPYAIKLIRDNKIGRQNAGLSASSLTTCPRELALLEKYDYYEPIPEGWIKAEGTIIHAMIETDPDPNPNIITEKRFYRYVEVDGEQVKLSGQMDAIDLKHKILIDYKRKEKVPTRTDPTHEFQFNVYCYIIRQGFDIETDEPFAIDIERGGMHYVSRNKSEPFLKVPYPVWDNNDIEDVIRRRLRPILAWRKTNILPVHNPYQTYGASWKCGCEKIEEQLRDRGVWND